MAAMHSGVIEKRGMAHKQVTKESFRRRYTTRPRALGWRFNSAQHKISSKWSGIMDRRTWASPTPETARISTAAWRWARTWDAMPLANRPALSDGQLTSLIAKGSVVSSAIGDEPVLSLGNAKWAGFALPLVHLGDGIYKVGGTPQWIHCWNPEVWITHRVEW